MLTNNGGIYIDINNKRNTVVFNFLKNNIVLVKLTELYLYDRICAIFVNFSFKL